MVYAADGEDPVVLGSQWRLAPVPIDSDASLIDKYRVNLSRGAFAVPMNPEQESAVNSFAKLFVADFMNCNREWQNVFREEYAKVNHLNHSDRDVFFLTLLTDAIFGQHGVDLEMAKVMMGNPGFVGELAAINVRASEISHRYNVRQLTAR